MRMLYCGCDLGPLLSGCNRVDHYYGIIQTCGKCCCFGDISACALCTTLITFPSFIGFWHISNDWKEYEVSYEFSVAIFLE
jgi:hypothetical protein